MNDEILQGIKELADDLARRFPVESIVLFGSFVEGKPEPNDIDLFLVEDLNKSEIIDWILNIASVKNGMRMVFHMCKCYARKR